MKSKDGKLIIEKQKYFRDGTETLEKTSMTKEDIPQYAKLAAVYKFHLNKYNSGFVTIKLSVKF